MKTLKNILGIVAAAATMTACVGDLNVTPIDPNANTVDKVLTSQAALDSYISGVYLGFATSGYYGPNGSPSISGLDGGASQYIRGLYHHEELTTDESLCGWNDQTIKNFHYMNWTTDDTFIYAFYSRIFMQVASANEFIREVKNLSNYDASVISRYVDEARVLRAIAYYHALDCFGNVPFATEDDIVGVNPSQISRADLFTWLEKELTSIIDAGNLPGKNNVAEGHVSMGAAKFLLAKLYLNAGRRLHPAHQLRRRLSRLPGTLPGRQQPLHRRDHLLHPAGRCLYPELRLHQLPDLRLYGRCHGSRRNGHLLRLGRSPHDPGILCQVQR